MVRIGIPRALLYYQYYPMWKTFFECLGAEVIVSDTTSKTVLTNGIRCVVAETCLPTKIFCGHVQDIADKVDFVFVPSIRSLEPNVYNCSKFLGLPDLVRNTVPGCPTVIDMEIDVNKGPKRVRGEIHSVGLHLTRDTAAIDRAWQQAQAADRDYHSILQRGLTPDEAIVHWEGGEAPSGAPRADADLRVAVVGHPYNIYDGYINHNLLQRIERMGVQVLTAEQTPGAALDAGTARLVGKPYWTYEDELVGAAGHYLYGGADGVICVVSFGCGPDSLMVDVVRRAAKQMGQVPLSVITLDEHTGEAGLLTRLEAFVDMLRRRRNRWTASRP
ncbi:MAG: acyl-CoA dehydratase activase-related protein [Chloroflexi bacterium]|nr:acyl-CoA dehydratase activase-related protein [Chloroflexota bacterium]MCL5025815.1 acyl-CoA dehydratase activase-related protein [Chloroflexota bacterium]